MKYQYLDWAKVNQTLLSDPSFYQVMAGDPWIAPQPPPPPGTTPPAGTLPPLLGPPQ